MFHSSINRKVLYSERSDWLYHYIKFVLKSQSVWNYWKSDIQKSVAELTLIIVIFDINQYCLQNDQLVNVLILSGSSWVFNMITYKLGLVLDYLMDLENKVRSNSCKPFIVMCRCKSADLSNAVFHFLRVVILYGRSMNWYDA